MFLEKVYRKDKRHYMKKSLVMILVAMTVLILAACNNTSTPARNASKPLDSQSDNVLTDTSDISDISDIKETAVVENPNFSWGGYVANDKEDTFFVNSTKGEWTYKIIRIGNEKNSEPTVVYSTSDDESVISRLALSESKIFFIEQNRSGERILKWISKDGKATGIANCSFNTAKSNSEQDSSDAAASSSTIQLFNDSQYLYFCPRVGDFKRFNLNIETEEELSLSSLMGSNESYMIIGIHRNKVYYVKGSTTDNKINNGIYYTDLDDMKEQELCALDINSLRGYPRFAGNYIYFSTQESILESIDLTTGDKSTVCTYTVGYGMDFIAQNDIVYYFNGSDIWTVSPDGSGAKLLIEDTDKENRKTWLQVSGDWIYYGRHGRNDPEFYRIEITGKIFPSYPIYESASN